ncbi:MAG: DUF47 family protein [Magnetococcales bacterium]|nr:DUF47 family protein [Magnetococcales bacterium]
MSGSSAGFSKLLNNVFPRMPDFYGQLNEQCNLVFEAASLFVEYMEKNDPAKGEQVAALEHAADDVKARNLTVLAQAFATPMDREDLFRAISSIDMVLNYLKTTVREMQVLNVKPDAHTIAMANLLKDGTEALKQGYAKLSMHPASAEADCQVIAKTERNIEKEYRKAIASLFSADDTLKELHNHIENAEERAIARVLDMFRRREVYRHISNAADTLKSAGSTLHDIVVQIA